MPLPNPAIDSGGLLEYSVVYTDRSLNHMSARFQQVMKDLSAMLRQTYSAEAAVVLPGSGTYAMEAVARQLATDSPVLIVRNGLFSYRWSQILETGHITGTENVKVLQAAPLTDSVQAAWAPPDIDAVVSAIQQHRPAVFFAAHVETASGIMLPDEYIRRAAAAVHEAGGLFVLDCIASGAAWVDMEETGVDVLVSAPQKGWSSAAGAGIICFSDRALGVLEKTRSSSFALDLRKWLDVMRAYENDSHTYYATLPTMTLLELRDAMKETLGRGLEQMRDAQFRLGDAVRNLLVTHGFPSVAAPGFEAPGVVVSHTDRPEISDGSLFRENGMQIAAGVPLQCGEPDGFRTFRLGLFGLDKLGDVDGTVGRLRAVLYRI